MHFPTRYQCEGMVIRSYEDTQEDARALTEALKTSYEHLKPWMIWANPNPDEHYSLKLIQKNLDNYLRGVDFVLGIWEEDVLIGSTGFHPRWGNISSGNIEVGMWIRQDCAYKGVGTKALRLMLDWGFEDWGFERVVWMCDTKNIASSRVAEKNGLTLEGTLRKHQLNPFGERIDMHLFAILKEEWMALRAEKSRDSD